MFFLCSVLFLTHVSLPQDSQSSKIPEGEEQFTQEQLAEYYLVYKNADVKYLRTVFDGYLGKSGGTEEERRLLNKWSKDYFRSKFVVMSRDNGTFGGTLITILFQDRPDKVFVTWVYPEGNDNKLALRAFDASKYSEEDIKRIKISYKKLLDDRSHAM